MTLSVSLANRLIPAHKPQEAYLSPEDAEYSTLGFFYCSMVSRSRIRNAHFSDSYPRSLKVRVLHFGCAKYDTIHMHTAGVTF